MVLCKICFDPTKNNEHKELVRGWVQHYKYGLHCPKHAKELLGINFKDFKLN